MRAVAKGLLGVGLYPILAAVAITDVHVLLHERLGGWIWLADVVGVIISFFLWPFGRHPVVSPGAFSSEQPAPMPEAEAAASHDGTSGGGAGEPVQETRSLSQEHGIDDHRGGQSGAAPEDDVSSWDRWVYGFLLGDVLSVSAALAVTETAMLLVADHANVALRLAPLFLLTIYCAYRLFVRLGLSAPFTSLVLKLDPQEKESWDVWLGFMVSYLVLMTALFGGWTAFWQTLGVTGTGGSSDGSDVLIQSNLLFVWHFLDSIPLLEIPDTVHWSRPAGFDDWRVGMSILAYRILVILPLIAGAIALYRALWKRPEQADAGRGRG